MGYESVYAHGKFSSNIAQDTYTHKLMQSTATKILVLKDRLVICVPFGGVSVFV